MLILVNLCAADVCLVNSDKPLHFINFSKLVHPVHPIDVCKSVRPVKSNKPVYPVVDCKLVCFVDICEPVCPFFVDYWIHLILFFYVIAFCSVCKY